MSLAIGFAGPATVRADLRVRDICRVKGQERNVLHGIGIVVGLNGTGDTNSASTSDSLVRIYDLMGVSISRDEDGRPLGSSLKDTRNTALVWVTADLPAHGGKQGDEIDCTISSISNAKSLDGGQLFVTPLFGPTPKPRPELNRVYAYAQGQLHVIDRDQPTIARVAGGCRLEQTIVNPFVKDEKITLVLDENHAGFAVAQEVEDTINAYFKLDRGAAGGPEPTTSAVTEEKSIAKAVDQQTVEVRVLDFYKDDPVQFASMVLEQRLQIVPVESRVIVNESTGVIAIGADVEISPTAITHRNMMISVGETTGGGHFMEIDPAADTAQPKLKALVESLNALRVTSADMVQIIRELDHRGAIHAHVIYRR